MRRPSSPSVLRLVGLIFGGVTLVLLLIAGGIALHTRSFVAASSAAEGIVIATGTTTSCSTDSDGRSSCSTTSRPTVRFTAADGREIVFTSRVSTNPPSHYEGDVVRVLYRPESPQNARIDSFTGLWLAPVIVGGIGALFGLFSGLLLLIARAAFGGALSSGDDFVTRTTRTRFQTRTTTTWTTHTERTDQPEQAEAERTRDAEPRPEPEPEPEPGEWRDPGTLR